MRAIVTGAAGFIGNALAKKLLEMGWDVLCVDSLEYGDRDKWLALDTGRMVIKAQYLGALEKEMFDYIFHFGSPSSDVLFRKEPLSMKLETLTGFINMAALAKNTGAKLIFPSTSSIYGVLNDYAKTKISLESLDGLLETNALILRIFAGFGETENHKGEYASVVYQFCKQALNDEEIVIFGDGSQSRDFVHVDDVVRSILKMIDAEYHGVVDIGTGISTSFNEILEIISKLTGKKLEIRYIDKPTNYLESTKCETPLEHFITVEAGIQRILNTLN